MEKGKKPATIPMKLDLEVIENIIDKYLEKDENTANLKRALRASLLPGPAPKSSLETDDEPWDNVPV